MAQESIFTILGMGFTGYAIFDGLPLLLLPSDPTEEDNLIKSEGAYATVPAFASGPVPARDRRALRSTVSTVFVPRLAPIIARTCYDWRINDDEPPVFPLTVVPSNDEGYETTRAHVDTVTVSSQEDALVALQLGITTWVWNDLQSLGPTEKVRTYPFPQTLSGANFLEDSEYKPVPHYHARLLFPGAFDGDPDPIVLNWSLTFTNNWQYLQLLEGEVLPPTPRLTYPGRLDVQLNVTWLARRNLRPREGGFDAIVEIGDPPVYRALFRRMIRDNRTPANTGTQSEPIEWTATFYLLGEVPETPP